MQEMALSLRERKKRAQKTTLQQCAIQLFRRQGYAKTTVEQIAAAANVSPATFFNYFPAKANAVLFNPSYEALRATYAALPPELSPLEALRRAMQTIFAPMPPAQLRMEQERFELIRKTPELHAAMVAQMASEIPQMADCLGSRYADRAAAEVLAGAVTGVGMAIFLGREQRTIEECLKHFDAALAALDTGF